MKFCPKCQARLKLASSDSEFVCPKCGYSERGSKVTKEVKNENVSSIIAIIIKSRSLFICSEYLIYINMLLELI